MCEEWMPSLEFPLTIDQYRELPRHAAYRYEYLGGKAYLTPRPRHCHALLDLSLPGLEASEAPLKGIRPVQPEDWPALEALFASAFAGVQPFESLNEVRLHEAAQQCLTKTRTGGDGPPIGSACLVAEAELPWTPRASPIVGTILPTLLPAGDPTQWSGLHWLEAPPEDAVERRLGRPHLTWVFVSPELQGQGVASALLAAAARELRALGFTELLSTFLVGNDASALWHWRCGFRLLAQPGSRRRNYLP